MFAFGIVMTRERISLIFTFSFPRGAANQKLDPCSICLFYREIRMN